jgi:membrane protease YdiL (CAAX protease family)
MHITARRTAPRIARPGVDPVRSPLIFFAAVALPSGWILLGIPVALGLTVAPFVLATLLLGLVAPALLLTRRDPDASVRALLLDTVRIGHGLLLVPALTVIPGLTWVLAAATGNAPPLDGDLLGGALVTLLASVLVVNLWEEMAWQGFFQRRASARWGFVRGAVVTAVMFVGVHLALAFAGVDDAGELSLGLAALAVSGIGLRLLLGALDRWSAGSILVVAVAHGSFNSAADFVHPDADWIRYTVTLILGLAALATVLARRGGARG